MPETRYRHLWNALMELPIWEAPFPSPRTLREEVDGMVAAICDVLFNELGDVVAGIYLVGSAQHPWDTPIDYVPELSDVDIHLHLTDMVDIPPLDAARSLDIQRQVETRFFARHPHSLHVPRPQIVVQNNSQLREDPLMHPSRAIRVLYGEPYPESPSEPARFVHAECERMLGVRAFIDRLPYAIVDRPGHYLWEVLRSVARHISAVGPRVLMFAGLAPDEAWSLNRTSIVGELNARGESDFAYAYASYYIATWQYHFSGRTYSVAAREAVRAGVEVLERGIESARAWKASVV
jgi:hypothetical protein